ncbi:MAG: N utilization substance protein B, partial [Firmicutes bacterium]|nr:N utilization substance protein B [Bacillota bacterium]
MRRTEARENLMMLIFQMDAQQDRSEEAINAFKRNYMFESDQLGYFDTVLGRYLLNSTEIDDIIEKNSSGWHLSRMA